MITLVCYKHLGLNGNSAKKLNPGESKLTRSEVDSYFMDFIGSAEFGKVSRDRMVALRGNGIDDYIREFHHQMKLRFPKESRIPLLWPILWILTLACFLINNRKIRNVSLGAVLKTAGKRGKMTEKLHLFK